MDYACHTGHYNGFRYEIIKSMFKNNDTGHKTLYMIFEKIIYNISQYKRYTMVFIIAGKKCMVLIYPLHLDL